MAKLIEDPDSGINITLGQVWETRDTRPQNRGRRVMVTQLIGPQRLVSIAPHSTCRCTTNHPRTTWVRADTLIRHYMLLAPEQLIDIP